MAIECLRVLSTLISFVGTALLFSMCFQWGCQSWCAVLSPCTRDPGWANHSATFPLSSGIDPGCHLGGYPSRSYHRPLIALRWKLQGTKRQTNQSILQCNCFCALHDRGTHQLLRRALILQLMQFAQPMGSDEKGLRPRPETHQTIRMLPPLLLPYSGRKSAFGFFTYNLHFDDLGHQWVLFLDLP